MKAFLGLLSGFLFLQDNPSMRQIPLPASQILLRFNLLYNIILLCVLQNSSDD